MTFDTGDFCNNLISFRRVPASPGMPKTAKLASLGRRRVKAPWYSTLIAITTITVGVLVLGILLVPNLGVAISFKVFGASLFMTCQIRKGPMVQLIGDSSAVVVWETCRVERQVLLRWNDSQEMNVDGTVLLYDKNKKSSLFKGFLHGLPAGKASYEIKPQLGGRAVKFNITIPSPTAKLLRVVVVGDNQAGYRTFNAILPMISSLKPDVFLHVGDMVQTSYKDNDWQTYLFDPLERAGLLDQIPFILTQGNHDIWDGKLSPFVPSTDQLLGQPSGYYYALTLANIRFIIIDANTEDDAQIEWLRRELSSETSRRAAFRVVSTHIPPFIEYWDQAAWDDGESHWPDYVRERMVPLFEEFQVDLVISGHQHNYQRGNRNGITFVITGGGGEALDKHQVEKLGIYKRTIIKHHFTILDMDQERIRIRMYNIDGSIGDEYVINKQD